jgi:hypothetical protein
MKTFFTVFFAILAAAVVIFGALSVKTRLDDWERSKRMCYSEIQAILRRGEETVQMQKDSFSPSDSPLAVAQRSLIYLRALEADQRRMLDIERTLVTLLENKPFGLPLTTAERKELESAKADIQTATEKPNK